MLKKCFFLILFLLCIVNAASAGVLGLKWSFDADVTKTSPAIGQDGTIYIGSNDNKLYALNPNGSKKWAFLTQGNIDSTPVITDSGLVLFVSSDDNLYALDTSGNFKWAYRIVYTANSNIAVSKSGDIYVSGDKLYAFNQNGSVKWTKELWYEGESGSTLSSPSLGPVVGGNGHIYVGQTYGLFSLDSDGNKLWQMKPGGDCGDSGCVYYASNSLSLTNDDKLLVGNNDNKLYCISSEGAPLWSFATSGAIKSTAVTAKDGTIYVGSDDWKVYAIDQNGNYKWSYFTSDDIISSPAVDNNGTVYVTSKDDNLYVISSQGDLLGKRSFDGWIYENSPVISKKGNLYLTLGYVSYSAINGSNVFAFSTNSTGYADSPWPMLGQNPQHTSAIILPDLDADGIPDQHDNCPNISNTDQSDIDKDNYGDACDAFPSNASEWLDTDNDKVGNNTDLDDDGDGVNDLLDSEPLDSSVWKKLDLLDVVASSFESGEKVSIQWPTVNGAEGYKVKFSMNNGSTWSNIGKSDSESMIWTIPLVGKVKNNCQLKIVAQDAKGNALDSRKTASNFTLAPPQPVALLTDLSASYDSADSVTLDWFAPMAASSVKVQVTTDGGLSWETLANGSATIRPLSVSLPYVNKAKTDCKFKLTAKAEDGTKLSSASSELFAMTSPLQMTSPVGGEGWLGGSQQTISWSLGNLPASVEKVILKYTTNGGKTWKILDILVDGDATAISYSWAVPVVGTTKRNTMVKIILKDADGSKLGTQTSAPFSLLAPTSEGLYDGVTSTNRATSGLILDDGVYYILYSPISDHSVIAGIVQGKLTENKGSFTSSNTMDFNFEGLGALPATLAGNYVEGQSIEGIVSYPQDGDVGFSGTYNSDYDITPSLATITGTYNGEAIFQLGKEVANFTISSNGAVAGSGVSGCQFTGSMTPRSSGNVYDATVSFGGLPCHYTNQTMSGISYYNATDNILYIAAPNADRSTGFLFVGQMN